MRRIVGVLVATTIVSTACGSGANTLQTVQSAAARTTAASTTNIVATVKGDSGLLAKGLTYTGGFDFAGHRGHFRFDASSLGIPGFSGDIDAVFDFSTGAVVYEHIPQLASALNGKSWVKVDIGALSAKTTGIDISSLVQSQGSDPTSGLQALAGATQVTKVGSEDVRGTPTTHFHVIVDIVKAADAAPPAARDAKHKLADLYIVKTTPLDVWLDTSNRVRRSVRVIDPANLKLPTASATAAKTGKITITQELFDFGTKVDDTLPPADQVADISQLLPGGTTPTTPTTSTTTPAGPASAAKAAYIAKANAICQVMNDKNNALPSPGTDPGALATLTQQTAANTADALRRLRALPAPAGDAATLRAIFAKLDMTLADASALISALRSGNQTQAGTVGARLASDAAAANAASNAYGLTVCGS